MFVSAFNFFIYDPLYNALVFLVSVVPFANVGLAVILLTIVVKLILFPLSLTAVKTQILVRSVEPKLDVIKKKYAKDKAEQARKTMDLYKEHGIKPFSSILLILLQLPIIFGLYWVFFRGGLPALDQSVLYAFTPIPEMFNMHFLWVSSIAERSVWLAILVGVTLFVQMRLTLPPLKKRTNNASLKDDLARSMHLQMRYVMPLILGGAAWYLSTAIALYWATSNIFTIGQELFVRKKIRGKYEEKIKTNAIKEVTV